MCVCERARVYIYFVQAPFPLHRYLHYFALVELNGPFALYRRELNFWIGENKMLQVPAKKVLKEHKESGGFERHYIMRNFMIYTDNLTLCLRLSWTGNAAQLDAINA
jgi:hypothetical protein